MEKTKKTTKFGFVCVDKPSGVSSSFVVNRVKRLTGLPCGHLGTLDPMASGVLPVGVGNATRLFDYFLQKKKTYVAEFLFGANSDTLDTTGELEFCGAIPTEEEIARVLPSLTGDVMQMPPKYSAKNVGGKRGYELARAGVEFSLSPKKVTIDEIISLGKGERENTYRFRIVCGSGTYIRSIARDMGIALSTCAVMSALRREKSGRFTIENAVPMDELTEENIESYILPTEEVLPFEKIYFKENDRIFNGVKQTVSLSDGEYKAYRGESFYGIAEVKNQTVKIKTKLC